MSIAEHNRIITALSEGDREKADQEARNHIDQVYHRSLGFAIFDNEGDYVLPILSNENEKEKEVSE